MNRWLILTEGASAGVFDPLDQVRPPFLLRNGAWTIAERWIHLLNPAEISAFVRPFLSGLVTERTGWTTNDLPTGQPDDVWVIAGTGSPRLDPRWESLVFSSSFVWSTGQDVVLRLDRQAWDANKDRLSAWLTGQNPSPGWGQIPPLENPPITGASGLWDLVNHLRDQLTFDWGQWCRIRGRGEGNPQPQSPTAVVLEPESVWIGRDVQIGPHTVIDARPGPVILDDGVRIEPFTRLEGPAYVGPHTHLVGGRITGGCAFGPGCKVGGEIEAAIFQGFSNKVHEGFIGHSVLGEWVNLGALTTNSDLKNNYGSIRVVRGGKTVDTGCLKVGSYLSDHTKTAIGTLLPTGSTTGVGVNLLSGGLAPKSVPPFVWGGTGGFSEHRLDRMLETARTAIKRRGSILKSVGRADQLCGGEEEALRVLFMATAGAREAFLCDAAPPAGRI